MNILFLYPSPIIKEKGGIQRVTHILANSFEKNSKNIFFLGIKHSDIDTGDERQFYLPNAQEIDSSENLTFLLNFIKRNNIDIIINQAGVSPEVSNLAYKAKSSKAKLISVIHNAPLANARTFTFVGKLKKFGIKLPKCIINSSLLKNILLALYKRKYATHFKALVKNSDKVVLLSDTFIPELEFFLDGESASNALGIANPISFEAQEIDFSKKKKQLLFVGRMDYNQKRPDLALYIWQKLQDKYKDWQYIILGDGDYLPKLKALAQKLNLKNIEFKGTQDSKPYYEQASIFTLSSAYEGFGIVLVEAMQSGTVPLAFDTYASLRDIIDDNINGYIISPFDISAYAKKISELIDDEELRLNFAKSCLEKSKKFSINSITSEWERLFNSLS